MLCILSWRYAERALAQIESLGDAYVVVAQQAMVDGRKLHATAALYAAGGRLHAFARALWITLG